MLDNFIHSWVVCGNFHLGYTMSRSYVAPALILRSGVIFLKNRE